MTLVGRDVRALVFRRFSSLATGPGSWASPSLAPDFQSWSTVCDGDVFEGGGGEGSPFEEEWVCVGPCGEAGAYLSVLEEGVVSREVDEGVSGAG